MCLQCMCEKIFVCFLFWIAWNTTYLFIADQTKAQFWRGCLWEGVTFITFIIEPLFMHQLEIVFKTDQEFYLRIFLNEILHFITLFGIQFLKFSYISLIIHRHLEKLLIDNWCIYLKIELGGINSWFNEVFWEVK